MEIKVDARNFFEIEGDALAFGVYEGEKPEEGPLAEIDKRSGGVITSLIETGEFTGKAGESAYIHTPGEIKARRLLLLGAGKSDEFNTDVIRKLAGTAARALRSKKARNFIFLLRSQLWVGESAQAATEGALLALFDPDKYHTSDKGEARLNTMILATTGGEKEELKRGAERGRI